MDESTNAPAQGITRLFLDTEWADTAGHQLVSLALVDEQGGHRFYAEVDPLPPCPTDFARFSVYPLLERGWSAMQQVDLTRSLRRFINHVENPVVLHDHARDWPLFCTALSGFRAANRPDIQHVLLCRNEMSPFLERYFHESPGAAGFRHHAKIDAEALRWAYLRMQERGLMP